MIIENRLRTAKVRMAYLIMFTFIGTMIAYNYIEYSRQYIKDLIFIVICLTISEYLFMLIIKLNYFSINTKGNSITIRYYTAHPLVRKYRFFKIPTVNLSSYTIEKSFLGLKKEIKFVAKKRGKTFNFPPISISGLHRTKIDKLTKLLDDILEKELKTNTYYN